MYQEALAKWNKRDVRKILKVVLVYQPVTTQELIEKKVFPQHPTRYFFNMCKERGFVEMVKIGVKYPYIITLKGREFLRNKEEEE